jgi:hexosaminidase
MLAMLIHILTIIAYAAFACALWPEPTEIKTGDQTFWLNPNSLKAVLRCDNAETILSAQDLRSAPTILDSFIADAIHWTQLLLDKVPVFSENKTTDSLKPYITETLVLRNAVHETFKSIGNSEFIPWKSHPRHSNFEPPVDIPRRYISLLEIQQTTCPSNEKLKPQTFFDGNEAYEIIIHNDTAILRADDTLGTLRGLQSFQQLFYSHSGSSDHYTNLVPVTISDHPKWKHRGISIDIARNPFQPHDLIRTIDAMARTKLSRLHVHATDSQSWPIEIRSLPDLARKGAYHPSLVWTTENLEHIQSYGVSKGISVFIEIDMPGHTASIAHAYPHLIAAFNELDWSTFALEPLSGQLKLNSSEVTDFVTEVLNDLLSRGRPFTSLYHIGGDEINLPAYLLDETVHSDDPAILQPLLQRFIDHIIGIASGFGYQPIVWEEMLLDWNLTLPSAASGEKSASTLVQVWRNSKRIDEVLKKGHKVIFGDYGHWYLDCKLQPLQFHP